LNVTYIGENAFRGTEFINGYKTATGNDFAVIGSVLVKYVGDTTVTEINVDTANALLENVDTIAPGAFSELTALETVTIGDGIKYIYDKAFYKDTALATVLGGGGLEYVASDAFDQTAYVSTRPVDDVATPTDESTFLRIGSIYYRYVGTGKSAEIPAGVKVIAPNAFSTGHLIENITFGDASQIQSIGADAFANTKWINENHTTTETGDANTFVQDGFVVINGILIAKRGRDAVVELPDLVRVIATGAFDNAYVTNLTITADSHLELIERDAFNGASNLKALSFINATDSVFVNFNDGAFSNENGEVINDEFKIYLYQAPITTLGTAVSDGDSDAVKAWKELYKGASEMFAVLETKSARINSAIGLPTEYLFDGAAVDFVSVWDSLGLLNAGKTHIVDGKIVVRSDGVESKEDLAVTDVTSLAGGIEVALDGTVGEGKTMSFKVDGVQAEGYAYSVYPAIKASTMAVWHVADDGTEVEGLPTFYTTQSNFNEEGYVIKIKFNYNNATGSQGEILLTDDMVTVTGYTPVYGVNKTLQIDVDYHGLAVYRVNAEYSVKKPQSVSIEQCSEMAISINALTAEINSVARNVLLKVTMSDGTFKYVNIDGKATFIAVIDAINKNAIAEEVSLDTTNLGYHTVGLRYGAPGDYVYCTVLYSVTLNTDGSMFNYTIDGDTATITSLKSGYDTTIAIPARVRLTDNGVYNPDSANEYTVVAIGDGAFKDRTNLEYVYIPATIKAIGNEAFMGCTDLKQIRSFTVTEEIDCGLSTGLVTFTEQQAKYLGEVTITGVAEGVKGEIEIPATVTYNKVLVGAGADGVDLDATYVLDVKLGVGALDGYTGAIVLPDTDYFRGYA
ncbi:MAG: leucine-rich repeat protein, partial [Clostridia bacterium]|nr:leucine-rich repeat protein [Clostridia bacterium]